MSPLVARWCLVGSAVVLVLVGVLADLAGPARAVLLAAAASCAVLDAVVLRVPGGGAPPQVVVTLPDAVAAPGAPVDVPADGSSLVLGRGTGGRPERVEADPTAPCHVVVLGSGSYARAVFDALGAQLAGLGGLGGLGAEDARATVDADADVRVVSHEGAAPGAPDGVRPTPTGTAVAARLDERGRAWATVVLVPGIHLLPRRRDHVLEVTRHGCRVWRDGARAATPVEPVLPLLAGGPVAGRGER